MSFPDTGQLANESYIDPRDMFAGVRYAEDFNVDQVSTAIIGSTAEVGQVDTVTVTWVANDQFGFIYDGVVIVATADTDDDTSALALEVAANTALTGALAGQIASVSIGGGNILTVNSVAGTGAHTLADYEPDTTTVVIDPVTAAAGPAKVTFGMGVVQDTAFPDLIGPGTSSVRQPLSVSDALWGVMVQQQVNNQPDSALVALGLPPGYLAPAPYHWQAVTRGRITVPWVGTLPTAKGAAAPVYWINGVAASAAQRGAFRSDGTNAIAVPNTEIERIITRPQGAFSGFVGINFKSTI